MSEIVPKKSCILGKTAFAVECCEITNDVHLDDVHGCDWFDGDRLDANELIKLVFILSFRIFFSEN